MPEVAETVTPGAATSPCSPTAEGADATSPLKATRDRALNDARTADFSVNLAASSASLESVPLAASSDTVEIFSILKNSNFSFSS